MIDIQLLYISWHNKLTLIFINFISVYITQNSKFVLGYWFFPLFLSLYWKHTNIICMVKEIFQKRWKRFSPAYNLGELDKCCWQWVDLKCTSFRNNGYLIWKICTEPSFWALISLPMTARVLMFLSFYKYLKTFLWFLMKLEVMLTAKKQQVNYKVY